MKQRIKKMSWWMVIALLFSVAVILVFESTRPEWYIHLRSDTDAFYFVRADYFLQHKNFTDFGYNEYQPGAMFFFLSVIPFLLFDYSTTGYRIGLFTVNIAFMGIYAYLLNKLFGRSRVFFFFLFLLCSGTIILHRFELYVSLVVIASLLLWKKGKTLFSLFVLGVATMIKVYPLILFPYYLLTLWKQEKSIRVIIRHGLSYVFGIIVVLIAYVSIFNVQPSKVLVDLNAHALKPVHTESLWGSALTVLPKIAGGNYAKGSGVRGIYGIAEEYTIGPMWFYNYIWVFPVGLFYLCLLFKKDEKQFRMVPAISLLLLFLIFSKILTAQYLYWFVFPMLFVGDDELIHKKKWFVSLVFVALILLLSQYVYPLQYNGLLGVFYERGLYTRPFWALFIRNVLLVVLFVRMVRYEVWTNTKQVKPVMRRVEK